MSTQYEVQGSVAVITLQSPPVNALSFGLRKGVMESLLQANENPDVTAIVLIGEGKAFCGGADLYEFGTPEAATEPTAWTVISALERSRKPVIAAIHSVCMGGGFELALGCHYRVAAPGCLFAFPEVKLGLLPGAGGTQRLPRALGVETALNMIVSGEPIPTEILAAIPGQKLLDWVGSAQESLLNDAIEFAKSKANITPPKIRDLPCSHPQPQAYFQFVRNMVSATANGNAAKYCINCVEAAATKKFDDGMVVEREFFMALLETAEFHALKHVFFAERSAGKIPDLPATTKTRPINSVGVVGAGLMGGGIAMNFLNAGIPVTILEVNQEALDKGVAVIRKNYESQVAKGRLKQDKFEQRMALLTPTLKYEDFGDADLVIEAVFEELSIKEKVFKQLDEQLKPGAILASNTSTLDLNKIAAFTRRPQDVVGLHFFSPANIMKLLEVVRGERTADDVLATVMALSSKIRKTAVVSGVCDGFIGNRMIEELLRQAGYLLDEGASPAQIDTAMEKFGMAMGPYRVADMAGNDISVAIRRRRAQERPELRYSEVGTRLFELGRHGVKTGAGWYDYVPGRRDPLPSPAVAEMLDAHRAAIGITPRKISNQEIVDRLVFALVNEGARILEEGIASRASDIDLIYILGYGFPAWRGGPMQYASEVGLPSVIDTLEQFQQNPNADPSFWTVAPLMKRLANAYQDFSKA
ncbi:3-hydroxyacyl-CoA dehydrogenase NAD-binding domain-containing protein [Pseudomonas sp. C11]|uniref:3-hydroxyacyl-CoA dehydrogenase NAD-binding domain-containing protein n=1 Tax=Pseudomonas sp. C11 TaxID=3075550 RepID=UPI002AFEC6BC|nr:3-hydroxyacyl-CoA dehydrogenase NAD-binding domain-containing protein [Pseudomonas sp. C11]